MKLGLPPCRTPADSSAAAGRPQTAVPPSMQVLSCCATVLVNVQDADSSVRDAAAEALGVVAQALSGQAGSGGTGTLANPVLKVRSRWLAGVGGVAGAGVGRRWSAQVQQLVWVDRAGPKGAVLQRGRGLRAAAAYHAGQHLC